MKKVIITILLVLVIALPAAYFVSRSVGDSLKGQKMDVTSKRVPVSEKIDFNAHPILKVALEQEGNIGGEKFWKWYGFDEHVKWCACYVSWCANEMGYLDEGIFPKFASCRNEGVPWFKEKDRWEEADYTPSPADLIFFDLNQDSVSDHVAFVLLAEGNDIYTIDGNARDICKQKQVKIDDPRIYGFGIPDYPQ